MNAKAESDTTGQRLAHLNAILEAVRKLVQANGGDIRVESNVNAGSSFTLVLPLQEES